LFLQYGAGSGQTQTTMQIQIVTPEVEGVRTGNRSSAEQWQSVLNSLGHEVRVANGFAGDGGAPDWLIALHAGKSAAAVEQCRQRFPKTKIALVLTGTDIYPEPSAAGRAAMRQADRLVGLQPRAAEQLPEELREKVRVIVQGAAGLEPVGDKSLDPFDVCVVGHLRDVKDPMLAAAAARLLPADSKIRVRHAGAILDSKYERLVADEQRDNPRYEWLGQLGATGVRQLIAQSQLLVLTSLSEGAGRVIGSAIAKGTPVLSTRVHGVMGLVGDTYPGQFPVGDAAALAWLMWRAEMEPKFHHHLARACEARAHLFAPEREVAGWRDLLEGK
jgi:putative glycosyltransferase (TIGR04348 family)